MECLVWNETFFQLLDLGLEEQERVLAQLKTMVSKCRSLQNNSVLAESCFAILIVTIEQDPHEQYKINKSEKDINPSV